MDSHEPDFIVTGERVALGPLRPDLAAAFARWMNQAEVREGLGKRGIASPETQEKWVQENLERSAEREPDRVEFTVYVRADGTPIGSIGLFAISYADGTAKLGIALGERRGEGFGTEATRLALDFAFGSLQLRNVMLEALDWNVAGLAAYERAGFRRIGVRRGAAMSRGVPHRCRADGRDPRGLGPLAVPSAHAADLTPRACGRSSAPLARVSCMVATSRFRWSSTRMSGRAWR